MIADGEVDVIADGANVATLGRGQGFGEIALLYDVPRTATVRTISSTRLYALERDDFVTVLTGHPSSGSTAHSLAQARLEELHALRTAEAAATHE